MKKYKNLGFWVGIIGIALAATGTQLSDLTSWFSVWELVKGTLENPYTLVGVVMAVYGSWNNPTKKGLN